MVGEYRLLSLLGEGGMGVVHLAKDRRTGERVALKLLRPQIVGDEEGRERLAREVSSLERVHSAWVAEIVDADPRGPVPYVATRYVQGPSLHQLVGDRGPLRGRELMQFARGLAEGIAGCHAAGVLHRDVKPSNVLMEGRTPILIDFGLAKVADDPRLTQTGWLLGTPGYLPPEVLQGESAGPASDVHSWAATVAFAATGQPPFGRGPSAAVMDRARRGEFQLPGVQEPLREVLVAALSPDPAARPTLDQLVIWLRDPSRPAPVKPTGRTVPITSLVASLDEPAPSPVDGLPAPTTVGPLEGMRRLLTILLMMLVLAAAAPAFPWTSAAVVAALVVLFRSGTLAGAAHASRRAARGARWYDGLGLVVTSPYHFVRSLPRTAMLLVCGAAGTAASVLVLHLAVGESLRNVALPAAGIVTGLVLLLAPGGAEVRRPLSRVVSGLSRYGRVWGVAVFVLLAAAAVLAAYAKGNGIDWWPAHSRPF